jgi:hypothetical protein
VHQLPIHDLATGTDLPERIDPRCPIAEPQCSIEDPSLRPPKATVAPGHEAACLLA